MLTGTNLHHAKRHNLRIVHETIRLYMPISRADVTRRTGLTAQTISNLVRQLVTAGLVVETERHSQGRGAPSILLEVNPDAAYAIGLDLDVDHLTAVLVDLAGVVRQRAHHEVALPSPDDAIALLDGIVRDLAARQKLQLSQIWGVGVGVPGPMVPAGGSGTYAVSPIAFSDWHDVPLAERLHERIGLPVFIENNATAAAVGEHWYGGGQHVPTFFYVYLGSGLGGGLVVQGAPFDGHTGNAGEIGYLAPRVGAAGRRPDVAHVGELFNLARLYQLLADAGVQARTPDDLVALHLRGEPTFAAWFAEAAEQLAFLVAAIEHLIDPQMIFLGGRWPDRLLTDLLERTEAHLNSLHVIGKPRASSIHLATAGADAAALGVATLPLYSAFAPLQRIDLKRAETEEPVADPRMALRQTGVVN